RAALDAGQPRSGVGSSFPLPTVFYTADMGWLGVVRS
ncbi:hypothetical protein Tco_0677397, partial [Tanacetum coccineum]